MAPSRAPPLPRPFAILLSLAVASLLPCCHGLRRFDSGKRGLVPNQDTDICSPELKLVRDSEGVTRDQSEDLLEDLSVYDFDDDVGLQRAEFEHAELEKEEGPGPEAEATLEKLPFCELDAGKRYLMVGRAYEQFMGARQVIGDAVAIAKRLDRVMVEPVMHNSRVVDPFLTDTWVPISQFLDVDAMKRYWPRWISINDFLALCQPGKHQPPRMVIRRHAKVPWNDTELEFRSMYGNISIISMEEFRRKGHDWMTSFDGVPLEPSPWIRSRGDAIVAKLEGSSGGFICAQWRSEQVVKTTEQLEACSHSFAETVTEATRCHRWNVSNGSTPNVLLLSDVREDKTSDTLHGSQRKLREEYGRSLEAALKSRSSSATLQELLRSDVPEMSLGRLTGPHSFNSSDSEVNASNTSASLAEHEEIDAGLQAAVEQYVCARASIMVACPYLHDGKSCKHCSRTQSKFAGWIHAMRDEWHMQRAIGW